MPGPLDAAWDYDAALVARVRAGEALAFQELFLRYRRLVYGLACRLLNDRDEAQDLTQEVFLVVHKRLSSLREPERLRAWLCRIAITRAYNIERSFRRRFRWFTVPLDGPGSTELAASPHATDPERLMAAAQTRSRIDEALAALPFNCRTVVVLRDIEGLSYEEIAEALDLNVGTVKSRLSRGRETLREKLADLLHSRREGTR